MQNVIVERVEKAREQIKTLRERSLNELQARKETLTHKADDAVHTSQEALLNAQATVLETTRDVLVWAGKQLSPLAEETEADAKLRAQAAAMTDVALRYLSRGEKALDEAIVALRAGDAATLPLDGYDDLSVKKVIDALDAGTIDRGGLMVLRAYEAEHKNRVTLLRELDARIEAPAPTE
jgi:hypothetical protein